MDPVFFSHLTEGDFDPIATLEQSLVEGDFETLPVTEMAGQVSGEYHLAEFADSQCVLLLHGDTLTDSGPKTHSVSAATTTVDTATYKFGTGSLFFDADTDIITIDDSVDFALGTVYTIDLWFRLDEGITEKVQLYTQAYGFQNSITLYYDPATDQLVFMIFNFVLRLSLAPTDLGIAAGSWYHVAVTCDGTNTRLFLNGSIIATGGTGNGVQDVNADVVINRTGTLRGHIDEFRVVKGRAEWTANFTPPFEAYKHGKYELFRGVDSEPDLTAAVYDTFYALPWSDSPAAGHDYYYVLRYVNEYGLSSQNTESTIVSIDAGGDENPTRPSAPRNIAADPAAAGVVKVTASYYPAADGSYAADIWLIYYSTDGSDPDVEMDVPIEIAMSSQANLRLLDYNLPAQADDTMVKVLVRTRRSGTPDADSTNTMIYTATANTDGPAMSPTEAFAAGFVEYSQEGN